MGLSGLGPGRDLHLGDVPQPCLELVPPGAWGPGSTLAAALPARRAGAGVDGHLSRASSGAEPTADVQVSRPCDCVALFVPRARPC